MEFSTIVARFHVVANMSPSSSEFSQDLLFLLHHFRTLSTDQK